MTNIELAGRGFERTEHEHPIETMRKRIEALESLCAGLARRLAALEPCPKSPCSFGGHMWRDDDKAMVCEQCGVRQEAK